MARFDAYEVKGIQGYLLDVQADVLEHLKTRVVIPLQPLGKAPEAAGKLNPRLWVGDQPVILATQFIGTIPRRSLLKPVHHLGQYADEVQIALDFLLIGF